MRILYEDNDLLVLCKPAGLSTESGAARHPSAEREALEWYRQKSMQEGFRLPIDPYLRAVHRLDRAASGVLVLAKSKAALRELMRQFEHREVEKTYQAWVEKIPPAKSGILEHWIKRDESGKRALVFDHPEPGSQPCSSAYRLLEQRDGMALVEIQPHTGRFHQIRAQLAHIGCPIVGDTAYGGTFWAEHKIKLLARRLVFSHPRSAKKMVVEAPWEEEILEE